MAECTDNHTKPEAEYLWENRRSRGEMWLNNRQTDTQTHTDPTTVTLLRMHTCQQAVAKTLSSSGGSRIYERGGQLAYRKEMARKAHRKFLPGHALILRRCIVGPIWPLALHGSLSNRPLHMFLRPGVRAVTYPAADPRGEPRRAEVYEITARVWSCCTVVL